MNGEKVICRRVSEGVYLSIPQTFNLDQIAESGQCFRMTPIQDGGYIVVNGVHVVKITPHESCGYVFHCSFDEFRDIWIPYFDLRVDYAKYQKKMAEDPFLQKAIEMGGGIRILKQDLWETVVTFVISQRNNIPRIHKSVETLCRLFGTPLDTIDGQTFYSFPTPEQLRGQDLSAVSLGYREKYVSDLAEYNTEFWEQLATLDDDTARKTLIALKGVGEKVANCIMLFGLHRMSSYPRDVWINRMIDDIYNGNFDVTPYAEFAGYVQQLQFFCYRKTAKEESA